MSYSESETEFSNSLSTLTPIFSDSESESDDSKSAFNSVFRIWTFLFFWPYICILLNNLAADVFYQFSKQNQ